MLAKLGSSMLLDDRSGWPSNRDASCRRLNARVLCARRLENGLPPDWMPRSVFRWN